jgi:hypothetical protein
MNALMDAYIWWSSKVGLEGTYAVPPEAEVEGRYPTRVVDMYSMFNFFIGVPLLSHHAQARITPISIC